MSDLQAAATTSKSKPNPRGGLVLLIALGFLALAGMGAVEYRTSYNLRLQMQEDALNHAATQARILADSIESTMHILDRVTDEAKQETLRRKDGDALSRDFRRIALFAPDVERIGFFDRGGILRASYSRSRELRENCARCGFFLTHTDFGDGFNIGAVSDAIPDGSFRLGISQRINAENGIFGGAVLAVLSPEQMERRFAEYISGLVGRIVLLDREGRQIARWPLSQPDNMLVERLAREIKTTDRAGFYVYPENLAIIHNLRQFPLSVAVFVNGEKVEADWSDKLRERAIQYMAFSLMIAVLTMVAGLQLLARYRSELGLLTAQGELESKVEARTQVLRRELGHRAKMERELFESEERFHQFMNNTPMLACIVDASSRVVFANRRFSDLCGRVEGLSLKDADSTLAALLGGMESMPLPQGRAISREVFLDHEGREHAFLTFFFPVEPASGVKYRGFAALDVTSHREAERSLAHAQKMEALGQLTGGVAHDFNNLLTIILGNLEMAADDPLTPPDIAKLCQEALQAARLGANLTDRLLAISRKRRYKPEIIEINSVLLSLSHLLRRSLGAAVEIRLRLCAESMHALIDPVRFENAVINLCLNSRDAMPGGGTVSISTRLTADGRGMVTVEDNGSGMSREVLEKAFEPFFTTKIAGKGTGLGLSMVHGLVVQSGGEISLDSTPGKGTSITMLFPLHEAAESPRTESEGKELPGGTETILVVEDSHEVRRFAVTALRSLGYVTLEASGPRMALEMLAEIDKCDLLFSDVVMPGGMDGYELAGRVRQIRPGIRILLTSGHVGEDAKIRDDIPLLAKPYGKPVLARAIREQLNAQQPESKIPS